MASGNLIHLRSSDGQKLLAEAQTTGGGYCQPYLLKIFNKQLTDYTCGIASCSLLLSAPAAAREVEVTQEIDKTKLPYVELNMFTFPETLCVVTHEAVAATGMTLDQVANLLTSHGRLVKKVHAGESSVVEFRADVISALSSADSTSGLIVNYDMDILGQKQPYGHHSPVGAYHAATDQVLVLDVWRHTEECWATVEDLFTAMNTIDKDSGLTRGYVIARVGK